MNCDGNVIVPAAREMVARPSSSGWRMVSSTLEERERESLTILKIIRDRLAQPVGEEVGRKATIRCGSYPWLMR